MEEKDDGSLAFLNIPRDENNRSFNCDATSQLKEYKQAIAPWLGWAQHSNSKHLLQTIIKKEYYGNL